MYFNEKHKEKVENRGDGYIYIGSYKSNEIMKMAITLRKS